jgi:4-hydroxy-3-methylbut-2-enyl diphosphate reductase
MQLKIADFHGFCGHNGLFGVSGALRIAQETARQHPHRAIYILGELVHNHHVTISLERDFGIHTVNQLADIPPGSLLIIKSHGLPPATIAQAKDRGLEIVDATCPMVKQVHTLVNQLVSQGKTIIYVASDPQHEEALGVYGEAPDKIRLLTLPELPSLTIAHPDQTVVLTQTTLSILETAAAFDQLQTRYPSLTIHPHICPATTQRQQAIAQLATQVDLIIIVGASHSSNSQRLVETARAAAPHLPVYLIDHAAQLNPSWLTSLPPTATIGLSSGASTPDNIFQAVVATLKKL